MRVGKIWWSEREKDGERGRKTDRQKERLKMIENGRGSLRERGLRERESYSLEMRVSENGEELM